MACQTSSVNAPLGSLSSSKRRPVGPILVPGGDLPPGGLEPGFVLVGFLVKVVVMVGVDDRDEPLRQGLVDRPVDPLEEGPVDRELGPGPVWVAQRIGMRTDWKPASLIRSKYSALSVEPPLSFARGVEGIAEVDPPAERLVGPEGLVDRPAGSWAVESPVNDRQQQEEPNGSVSWARRSPKRRLGRNRFNHPGATRPRPTGRSSPRPRRGGPWASAAPSSEILAEPGGDVVGEEFGRGVGDRDQGAFVAREAPVPVLVADPPVRAVLLQADEVGPGRQEHPVVELVDDGPGQILQGDEVEDVMVDVQVILDLDRRPVIVAVDALALVTRVGDEVARAEDQVILGDSHLVT